MLRGHKDYTGSGQISLYPVYTTHVTSTEFVVEGYKLAREGQVPSLWWKDQMGAKSSVAAQLCVRGSTLVVLV